MPQGKIGIEDLGQELKNKINKTIDISERAENGDFTYVHPNNSQTRHVTDLEKATWNDKADKIIATSSEDGLMSSDDKKKLNGIAVNANNYSHPGTHPASMISIADTSNLFAATDVEGALKEVFTNASNGKQQIVNAITGKGVAASKNDTFSELANKINQISSGKQYATGTTQADWGSTHGNISLKLDLSSVLKFKPLVLYGKYGNRYNTYLFVGIDGVGSLCYSDQSGDYKYVGADFDATKKTIIVAKSYVSASTPLPSRYENITWYAIG